MAPRKSVLAAGMVVGRLTLLEPRIVVRRDRMRAWLVRCGCEARTEKVITENNLTNATSRPGTRSCGCLRDEKIGLVGLKHGLSGTQMYRAWRAMLNRCYRPEVRKFECYGGRGIKVCRRWRDDFAAFLADVGPRPDGMSLDRINNDGDYEPGNVRWATCVEQANNRRSNRRVTLNGDSKTIAQWARTTGRSADLILAALRRGVPSHRAVFGAGVF